MLKQPIQLPLVTTTRKFRVVVTDPAAYFADPAAVIADAGLTRRQQLRLQTEWAQALIDRQVAADEGLAPDTGHGRMDDEANVLRQVNEAIETVVSRPRDAAPGIIARARRRLRPG